MYGVADISVVDLVADPDLGLRGGEGGRAVVLLALPAFLPSVTFFLFYPK